MGSIISKSYLIILHYLGNPGFNKNNYLRRIISFLWVLVNLGWSFASNTADNMVYITAKIDCQQVVHLDAGLVWRLNTVFCGNRPVT